MEKRNKKIKALEQQHSNREQQGAAESSKKQLKTTGSSRGEQITEQSRAEQNRAEQNREEQSRAKQQIAKESNREGIRGSRKQQRKAEQ